MSTIESPPELYMTRAELAARLRVAKQTVANWEKRGILRPFRIGCVVRYRVEQVEEIERAGTAVS